MKKDNDTLIKEKELVLLALLSKSLKQIDSLILTAGEQNGRYSHWRNVLYQTTEDLQDDFAEKSMKSANHKKSNEEDEDVNPVIPF